MKKLFLLTAIAGMFAFTNASAQKDQAMYGNKLGVGVEFGLPVGDFGDVYNLGVGGYNGGGYGSGFALLVVLFILLIIAGEKGFLSSSSGITVSAKSLSGPMVGVN